MSGAFLNLEGFAVFFKDATFSTGSPSSLISISLICKFVLLK
jgi:hypothetical protein